MAVISTEGVSWTSRVVTYSFATGTYAKDVFTPFDGVLTGAYAGVVDAAFADWGAASGLDFVQVPDGADPAHAADIRVGWANLSTGTTSDVIGHARWTYAGGALQPDVTIQLENPADIGVAAVGAANPYAGFGTSLMQIALHEIGHAIGLAHSADPGSVMFPVAGPGDGQLAASDAAAVRAIYPAAPPPPAAGDVFIADETTGTSQRVLSAAYAGPDSDLRAQYVQSGSDRVAIWATTPGTYVTGAGDDAIAVTSGDNVLDGGPGSNYLVGGTGHDAFFVAADRAAVTWDTIANFHAGDVLAIWGFVGGASHFTWSAGDGVQNGSGATMHISLAGDGRVDSLVTFAGLTLDQTAHFGMHTGVASGTPFLTVFV